jgi:hypothetical protein
MQQNNPFYKYYAAQYGGELPVYRGGRSQGGAGIGDILRSLFRVFAPVALRGIGSFAGRTLDAHSRGIPLGTAAKEAIMPTLQSVASQAAPLVSSAFNQAVAPQSQAGSGVLLSGVDGVPLPGAYKRRAIVHKKGSKKRYRTATNATSSSFNF